MTSFQDRCIFYIRDSTGNGGTSKLDHYIGYTRASTEDNCNELQDISTREHYNGYMGASMLDHFHGHNWAFMSGHYNNNTMAYHLHCYQGSTDPISYTVISLCTILNPLDQYNIFTG
jgi:hypothetical protein